MSLLWPCLRLLTLPLLMVSAFAAPALVVPEGIAGPMVGHVTGETAAFWMFAPTTSSCSLSYAPESSDEMQTSSFAATEEPASVGPGAPVSLTLTGLSPDTRYRYEVKVDGKSDPAWRGSFSTAPEDGAAGAFRLAVTSCMRPEKGQSSWFLLLAQQPDLHLTLGDTHYADTTNPTVQWQKHLIYRRLPEFATVMRSVPNYSIWDDHDYGPNDSDGTAVGKEGSLQGWRQFWANPGAGTPETPGAFYSFTRGEVEFFVVDGRYHRSPDKAPDDENKRMLGDAQFEWLAAGLKASKAKFKVIASGSTLEESKADGWKIYTFSRHRLFDTIRENRIGGVLYLAGDVHRSLVSENLESERVGYPLIEVISSGVANSAASTFATLDFDTTIEDPSVRVRIVHGDGTVRDDKSWHLSQLQVK